MLCNPLLTFYFKMFISTKAAIGLLMVEPVYSMDSLSQSERLQRYAHIPLDNLSDSNDMHISP